MQVNKGTKLLKWPLMGLVVLLVVGCGYMPVASQNNAVSGPLLERNVMQFMQDKANQSKVLDALYKTDTRFNYARINPHVFMGVLLLTGQVQDEYLVKLAVDSVQKSDQSGISLIHNYLQQTDKPTYAEQQQDQYLLQTIQKSLYAIDGLTSKNTYIAVEKASVFVMGRVSQSNANSIVKIIEKTPGVLKIVMLVDIVRVPTLAAAQSKPVSKIPVAVPAEGVSMHSQPSIAVSSANSVAASPNLDALRDQQQGSIAPLAPLNPSLGLTLPEQLVKPSASPTNDGVVPLTNQLRID